MYLRSTKRKNKDGSVVFYYQLAIDALQMALGRLKSEWIHHNRYYSRSEATQSIFYYIEIFYNRKRRHSSINYVTPQEYETFSLAA
jgi:transposase InsO family protein